MATVINVATLVQLRNAILLISNDFAADGISNGDPYTINLTADIKLVESLPMLRGSVPVDGSASISFNGNGHTIDANSAGRVFFVASGAVAINDLTIANARAEGGHGGDGNGQGVGAGGGGGLGAGAAVFVNSGAIVTLTNVTAHNAAAAGGTGGDPGGGPITNSGGGGGGGLGGDGGDGSSTAGGGGGGYEGTGGTAFESFDDGGGGGGGGGEFGAGGASGIGLSSLGGGGGGGGGGQRGGGGQGASYPDLAGGEGGGATTNGDDGDINAGAGNSAEGGDGGNDFGHQSGFNGGPLGGGGGGFYAANGGNGGASGGGGGGGNGVSAGGDGGLGGGGGGAGLLAGGDGGDFGGGGGTANGVDAAGGAGGFGGGGGGGGGGAVSSGGFGGGDGGSVGGGGGGDALGGAIFVRSGGSLIINNGAFTGSFSVTAGTPGNGAVAGAAHGSIFFLHGASSTTLGVSAGQSRTIGGPDAIAGTGSLTKTGAGTLILSGSDSYTGATIVQAGLLRVDGSIASATTVKNHGTLGGNGTTRAVSVEAGGTLSPGASAGILHTGNLVLAAGASLHVEIGGTSAGAGGYDRVAVAGTVKLAGATLDEAMLGGFVPKLGNSFTIIDNDGSDAVVGTFAGKAEGASLLIGGRLLTITYHGGNGNDVALTKTTAGAIVVGTNGDDLIDLTHTAPGQPLPTDESDSIRGLGGNDIVAGLGGNDILSGGEGNDRLTGAAGGDTFRFDTKLNKTTNVDHITDMVHLTDFIELDHSIFSKIKIGSGHLKNGAFFADAGAHKAHDGGDRIVYDTTSGNLYYDKDGKGGHHAKLFAVLDGSPDNISASDFLIVT